MRGGPLSPGRRRRAPSRLRLSSPPPSSRAAPSRAWPFRTEGAATTLRRQRPHNPSGGGRDNWHGGGGYHGGGYYGGYSAAVTVTVRYYPTSAPIGAGLGRWCGMTIRVWVRRPLRPQSVSGPVLRPLRHHGRSGHRRQPGQDGGLDRRPLHRHGGRLRRLPPVPVAGPGCLRRGPLPGGLQDDRPADHHPFRTGDQHGRPHAAG